MLVKMLTVMVAVSVTSDVVLTAMEMPAQARQRRSDDAGPLEHVVQQLAQQVSSLSAQLTQQAVQLTQQANSFSAQLSQQANNFETQMNGMKAEIAELKRKTDTLNQTVAFYAWNKVHPIRTTAVGILIMDHAQTNAGNAYNSLTGVFTAPVSGLYYFQTTFLSTHLGNGHSAHAAIFVDNQVMAIGISDTDHGQYDQTTISSLLHLSAGQQVYVKNIDSRANDYHGSLTNPHTTFSGFLLHAD